MVWNLTIHIQGENMNTADKKKWTDDAFLFDSMTGIRQGILIDD